MSEFCRELHFLTFDIDNLSNHIVGAISIFNALAVLLRGSDEECKKELLERLHVVEGEEHEIISRIFKEILEGAGKSEFISSNAVFTESQLKNSFVEDVDKFYDCKCRITPFSAAKEESIKAINDFVNESTKGKISEIIKDFNSDVSVIIINTVYFKGFWEQIFEKSSTVEKEFFKTDGSVVKSKFMHSKQKVLSYQSEECRAIQLSFKDSNIKCLLAMPNENITLADFLTELKNDQKKFKDLLNVQKYRRVNEMKLSLPKFKISSDIEMNKSLQNYGLLKMFDPSKANFKEMTDEDLFVSDVVHKAVFEFNEDGAEAAAATMITMSRMAMFNPEEQFFHLNRPFLFGLITDKGIPLFLGHIVDPTLS